MPHLDAIIARLSPLRDDAPSIGFDHEDEGYDGFDHEDEGYITYWDEEILELLGKFDARALSPHFDTIAARIADEDEAVGVAALQLRDKFSEVDASSLAAQTWAPSPKIRCM